MTQPGGPQIAVISLDGFDTHAGQPGLIATRLSYLDTVLNGLHTGLAGEWKNTVVIAVTEFGRTARVNGTGGTDHGTASTGLVLYGALGACTGSACTVTFASSKSIDQAITMNCASYVGVGSFGKPSYASGNGAPTITTTSLTPGSLAVNGIRLQMSTAVVGYNQTSRFADNRGSYQSVVLGECAAQSTAGASVTFSATSSTCAPESSSCRRNSRSVYSGFTLTQV